MNFIRLFLIIPILLLIYCGPKPTNTEEINGIPMIHITKVIFKMGDKYSKAINDKPVREKEVYPFYISSTEITNAQYAAFLNDAYLKNDITLQAEKNTLVYTIIGKKDPCVGRHLVCWINSGGADNSPSWLTFKNNSFGVVAGKEKLPVIAVTWYGAYAFAQHYGFRLPTEAEWECAARGGKSYFFGTKSGKADQSGVLLNYNNIISEPVNVGSYPPNSFGIYDMSGNVREWCLDRYESLFYSKSPEKNPYNKLNPLFEDDRVVRGGTFDSPYSLCKTYSRQHANPGKYDKKTGFRVIKSFYKIE